MPLLLFPVTLKKLAQLSGSVSHIRECFWQSLGDVDIFSVLNKFIFVYLDTHIVSYLNGDVLCKVVPVSFWLDPICFFLPQPCAASPPPPPAFVFIASIFSGTSRYPKLVCIFLSLDPNQSCLWGDLFLLIEDKFRDHGLGVGGTGFEAFSMLELGSFLFLKKCYSFHW